MLKIGTRTFQKVLMQMASKSHVPMSNRGVWFTSREKLSKLGRYTCVSKGALSIVAIKFWDKVRGRWSSDFR